MYVVEAANVIITPCILLYKYAKDMGQSYYYYSTLIGEHT